MWDSRLNAMGSSGTCFPLLAHVAMRSTLSVWSLARATTSARGVKASRRLLHPSTIRGVSTNDTRLKRRIPFSSFLN